MSNESEQKKIGRPSSYTEEMGDYICSVVQNSVHGIDYLSARDDKLPSASTIRGWLYGEKNKAKIVSFGDKYARAKAKQSHNMSDEIIRVCYETPLSRDETERAKLKVDALKWCAARLLPKVYSDNPKNFEEEKKPIENLSAEERMDKVRELVGVALQRKEDAEKS